MKRASPMHAAMMNFLAFISVSLCAMFDADSLFLYGNDVSAFEFVYFRGMKVQTFERRLIRIRIQDDRKAARRRRRRRTRVVRRGADDEANTVRA
jgi:hypothetical protein